MRDVAWGPLLAGMLIPGLAVVGAMGWAWMSLAPANMRDWQWEAGRNWARWCCLGGAVGLGVLLIIGLVSALAQAVF